MKLLRRVLIILIVLLLLPASAYASGSTLIVAYNPENTPAAGVEFELFPLDGTYSNVRDAYTALCKSGQASIDSGATNSMGRAVFTGVADGNYLVLGHPYRTDGQVYEPEMCMVTLPVKDENGNALGSVEISPKYAIKTDGPVEYDLAIIWKDQNYSGRPSSVEVALYRNETLHTVLTVNGHSAPVARSANGATVVTLSAADIATATGYNWRYSWTEDDATAIWTVAEKEPSGYSVTHERDGNTFIITNTLKVPSNPSDPKLPQTGQLWWPVPILLIMGMIFLLLGWYRRKESLNEA